MIQLRRITSTGRFVPEIDGLRFIAIASVVVYHFHGFIETGPPLSGRASVLHILAEHGYRGVNIFYVLSGFILGLPFAEHRLKGSPPVSLRSYFMRRLTRLEPPYFLNLFICSALLLVSGQAVRSLYPHAIASALYVHNIWFGGQNPANPVAWSLEVEVQFYSLAPLLAVVFSIQSKARRRLVLISLTVLTGAAQLLYWGAGSRFKLSILFAIQFFLTGFLLADLYLVDRCGEHRPQWGWDIVALAGWLVLFGLEDRQVWLGLPFLMLLVCIATFRGVVMNRVLRNGIIVTVGGMCYTIYLWHYVLIPPILRFTSGIPFKTPWLLFSLQAFIYLAVLLVVTGSYFALIERPCMAKNWPRRALTWFQKAHLT